MSSTFRLSQDLLSVLACPKCKHSLDDHSDQNQLTCPTCKLAYRIENGIPILLIEEAQSL